MMEYIDKKMNKNEGGAKPSQRTMTAEDELYVIPDSMVRLPHTVRAEKNSFISFIAPGAAFFLA